MAALVQVGSPQLPGYGGQAAPRPGLGFGYENWPGYQVDNGNGNGAAPGPTKPGPFDPRGAVTIPNNFWGFVILVMGMR